ncbi:ATP-binding protein [Burkholderia cepacia]|uniref:ATP-binding protein n=1 Tax=Burkholderia cepacia TaxID=292 RepID=UPI0039BDD7B6
MLGPRLVIVVEIGYLPLSADQASHFFQIVAKRYERGSMILTSNLPFGQWDETFGGNTTLTEAMLERIVRHARIIQIKGDCYRLKQQRQAGHVSSSKGERLAPFYFVRLGAKWLRFQMRLIFRAGALLKLMFQGGRLQDLGLLCRGGHRVECVAVNAAHCAATPSPWRGRLI